MSTWYAEVIGGQYYDESWEDWFVRRLNIAGCALVSVILCEQYKF
jgi:hypothetical protein